MVSGTDPEAVNNYLGGVAMFNFITKLIPRGLAIKKTKLLLPGTYTIVMDEVKTIENPDGSIIQIITFSDIATAPVEEKE